MSRFRKHKSPNIRMEGDNTAWRRYQARLKQKTEARRTIRRIPGYLLVFCISLALLKGGFYLLDAMMMRDTGQSAALTNEIKQIEHAAVKRLIDPSAVINAAQKVIHRSGIGRDYAFYTTLDPDLQKSLTAMMDLRWSRQIAIVVLEPQSGRILGLASHDKTGSETDPCLSAQVPAASLFKIVTAAAAVETCGYGPDTRLNFNGGKYTLYRSQLRETVNQYTNSVTLEQAFAESINPVFGKIGKHCLGRAALEKYAARFAFSRRIEFDLPLEPSVVKISDKSYNWAEIACGFNDTTRISPLHGAMLAAAIINNGRMASPRVVETVAVDNQVIYRGKTKFLDRCVTPQTALQIQPLMRASLTRGTARGSFRGKTGKKLLADFEIGGKTGSINDNPKHIRYDWFAGYARHKKSGGKIAVAVLVAHEKYIGTRAPEYFRKIVYEYFEHHANTSGN